MGGGGGLGRGQRGYISQPPPSSPIHYIPDAERGAPSPPAPSWVLRVTAVPSYRVGVQ